MLFYLTSPANPPLFFIYWFIFCVALLKNIVKLTLTSPGTLVPAAPCCVSCITFTKGLSRMTFFASSLIWYHTHIHIGHTGTNILTHAYKYILTPPATCTKQQTVLHWMNNILRQKFTLQRSKISLLFKNQSLVEVIYLLVR